MIIRLFNNLPLIFQSCPNRRSESFCKGVFLNVHESWRKRTSKLLNEELQMCKCLCKQIFHVGWEKQRNSHQRCSVKKVFLKISQNSQENTCARVLNKGNFIKKETQFFCEFCEISKNTFFTERLWMTASGEGYPCDENHSLREWTPKS